MLTPVISYATSDLDDSDTTGDGTEATGDTGEETSEPMDEISGTAAYEALKQKRQDESIVKEKQDEIRGHKFVTENSKYELYLNEDAVSILIRCKDNGAIVESVADPDEITEQGYIADPWKQFVDSGVSIQMLKKIPQNRFGNASELQDRLGAKESATKTYTTLDDGFKVNINYEVYKISFNLYVHLTDTGITYELPADEIVEGQDNEALNSDGEMEETQFYISNIYIFPMLGSTMLDIRDGYMVVPDGNGIIINLNDKEQKYQNPYVSRVYGGAEDDLGQDNTKMNASLLVAQGRTYNTAVDAEKLSVPVYGMVYRDSQVGMLTVMEEGEESAVVYANPNGATSMYWNMIYTKYVLRMTYGEKTDSTANAQSNTVMQETRQTGDIKTSIIITTGDKASYGGLAVAYRDRLIEQGVLSTDKDTSYRIRLQFLGMDKEDFLVFKRSVVTTTVSQIDEILKDLKEEGVEDVFVGYEGWQKGGAYSLPIKSFKVDGSIDGKGDLVDLIQAVQNDGNIFVLNDNALDANPDTGSITFNTIKKIDRSVYSRTLYGNVYNTMYAVRPDYADEYLDKVVSQMKDEGIKSILVSGISDQLYAHLVDDAIINREEVAAAYHETLADVSDDMYLALDNPFAYLWDTMDAYLNAPVSNSGFIYADDEIAFVTTVLKGCVPMYSDYVNFEADKTEYFLKLVETGVYPSFYLTHESPSVLQNTNSDKIYSSQYDYYKDEIVSYYKKLKELNDKIGDALVADYYRKGDVSVTVYDNGVTVYVNFSEKSAHVNGLIIPGNSYEVK